jgi:hypothetical protein
MDARNVTEVINVESIIVLFVLVALGWSINAIIEIVDKKK